MSNDVMMKNMSSVAAEPSNVDRKALTKDDQTMLRFGKRQQYKRNFGIISIVGLTCAIMITWEGVMVIFQGGFTNGGPTGLMAGYIFSWVGNILQALVMGELGSMIPLSGGQYNWVAILAPRSCHKFLSYMTGWITVIAWQAATASSTLLVGDMIQGVAVLNYPDYEPTRWQATLMFYAVLALGIFINTYLAHTLPQIEAIILVVHIIGFFAILVPLVYLSPKGTAADVWQTFFNLGGWSTNGLSFFVGATTNMFAFVGIDGAAHLAEEIENSASVIPKAMIITVFLNGILGFAMLLATLFCLGNVDSVLETATGFPFMQIMLNGTSSVGGTTGMICIILVIFTFTAVGILATTSRMMWAFAREKGLPGHSKISIVHPRSALPLWSIGVTAIINVILALINIGSSTAFNAFTGLTVAGFYLSFLMAACVMLHKRLTTPDSEIHWGPFKLGRWGVPVTVASIAYSVIGFFFSFWPAEAKVNATTMNWSIVVFGGALILAGIHWMVYARHHYKGPIMEIAADDAAYPEHS